MSMQVAFCKVDDGRLCAWIARIPKRRPLQRTTMASGRDLPHDLAQFVVESTLGMPFGFWGRCRWARPSRVSDAVPRNPGRRGSSRIDGGDSSRPSAA